MNKQRYLAELQKLLVYMTDEDRAIVLRYYGGLFDEAGQAGQAALIDQIGSPTKAAVALSRYIPGHVEELLPHPVLAAAPDEAAEPVPASPTAEAEPAPESDPLWEAPPDYEPPALPVQAPEGEASVSAAVSEDEIAPADEAVPETTEPAAHPIPEEDLPDPDSDPVLRSAAPASRGPGHLAAPAGGARKKTRAVYERSMPLGLGIVLFVFVFIALGIPAAALFCALTAICLAPGAAVVTAAGLLAVGGLWSTAFMADVCLLIGAAAITLALGLVVLFAGLWLAVRVWRVYGRGVGWLAGELLGRRVAADE